MKLKPSPEWVSDERCAIGENPLWDADAGTLSWINIVEPAVFHRSADGSVRRYQCPKPVGSLYLSDSGRLLVAMRPSLAWLDLDSGALEAVETSVALHADERYNDGRCDRDGVLWISTMDRKVERGIGSIVRFGASFSGSITATGAIIGNGVCFSPDDRHLYFSDSRGRAIHRYARQGPGLGPREVLLQLDADAGRPDGCTVDAEGCLWSARIGGSRIDRYTPDGRLVDSLLLPVENPTHCTFGGPDLRTLFVTTAHFGKQEEGGELAGAVLAYRMDVVGTPEHRRHDNKRDKP